jgi:outer membrane receptor protein involved in Fe transport
MGESHNTLPCELRVSYPCIHKEKENMQANKTNVFKITLSASLLILSTLNQAEELELSITADFRPTTLEDSTVSVTAVTKEQLKERGAEHIEEILNLAPNVNMSSGGSRAKYFQIRGIGERSQFISPVNPSVGLIIDNMDFSRSGGSATLFDIEQVEIIRGPQGTKYGSNALAGIIKLTTTEPSNERKGRIESTVGNYGQKSFGIAEGGPFIKNKLLGRFSLHSNKSDGFIKNDFLNRDDTNGRDELTLRGHLKWLANDDLTVSLRYLHLDIDNGYDAFTLDNSRNSVSDQPGNDKQKTNAVSLNTKWNINSAVKLETDASYSNTDIDYSYDEDWSYIGQFDDSLFPYSYFDQYLRDRSNQSLETKLISKRDGRIFNGKTDWVAGLYYDKKSEDLKRKRTSTEEINGIRTTEIKREITSQYDTQSTAIFGQLDTQLNNKTNLITGLRLENFKTDYSDSQQKSVSDDENLFGGKLGIEYDLNDDQLMHASISRGYKAGGVNSDSTLLSQEQLNYKTEYQWVFEVGINSSFNEDRLKTRLSAFYADRKDQQVKTSIVTEFDNGTPSDFEDFYNNAASGKNYGLEAELDWTFNDKWRLKSSLGLLQASFDKYDDPSRLNNGIDLNGRDLAHAPNYQYMLGADYSFTDAVTAGISFEGKDSFYFSNQHNAKSKATNLVNANISFKKKNWSTTLWARNLLDKDYDTRGFRFGNNPAKFYATETFTQKGEPRTVGVTVSYDF